MEVRKNNNDEYLERLIRTGPKSLHVLYGVCVWGWGWGRGVGGGAEGAVVVAARLCLLCLLVCVCVCFSVRLSDRHRNQD